MGDKIASVVVGTIFVSMLVFVVWALWKFDPPYPSIYIAIGYDPSGVMSAGVEPLSYLSVKKHQKKANSYNICGKSNKFNQFKLVHWSYYVENECGPLSGDKCCVKIKGDSGGRTCYGVAKNYNEHFYGLFQVFVKKNEKDAQIEEYAKLQIYSKYFKKPKIGDLYYEAVQPVFDYAVHSGVSKAVRELQKNIGASPDGKIGPQTIKASKKFNMEKYNEDRAKFIRSLNIYKLHTRGMDVRIKSYKKQSVEAAKKIKKLCRL